MSSFGRLLLVATALAPVFVVYGAAIYGQHRAIAIVLFVVAVLLTAVCSLLLAYIRRHGTREQTTLEEIAAKDTDVLTFLVAYLLPVVLADKVEVNLLAFATFLGVMGLVLFRADIYHVNPLMGILGYHFYQVKTPNKVTYLLITRRKSPLAPGDIVYIRLSRTLLLEREEDFL